MVKNVELTKKVNEKEEENIFVRDRLTQLEEKLEWVEEMTEKV